MIPCLALFTSCYAIKMDPWPDRNYGAFLARGEGQSQTVGYSITAFARPNYYQRLWVKPRVEENALGCDFEVFLSSQNLISVIRINYIICNA